MPSDDRVGRSSLLRYGFWLIWYRKRLRPVVGRLALVSSPGRMVVTVAPGTSAWIAACRIVCKVAVTVATARKLLIFAPQASRALPDNRQATSTGGVTLSAAVREWSSPGSRSARW